MSFLSPFILLFLLFKTTQSADLNVGTVLFTKADKCKECWSSESMALLTSRMILEDLLPSTTILVIDSNEFITDLVDYFRIILETVRQETHGKTKHITLMALTDLLGGYLHHAVLPIAKYSYYAGLIDYDSMATLLGLFDELKWFLRTNGQGWAKPLSQNLENFEVQRIPLQPCNDKNICDNLMLVQSEGGDSDEKAVRCDVTVPLPFFDSVTRPSAIALPTKTCPLHSLEANSSSYLVMNFFVKSYKCLQNRNAKSENVEKFQNDYLGWIDEQIMPRLEDEKFYAAFGGILRVRVTIQRLDVSQNNMNKQIDEFRHAADNLIQKVEHKNGEEAESQMSRSSMILMAVLITIFVWFFLGTLFICYKMKHAKEKEECDNEDCLEKTNTTSTGSSFCSSKFFYPERPSVKDHKGTADPEKDSISELDVDSYHKKEAKVPVFQRVRIILSQCLPCNQQTKENRRSDKKKYPIDSLHYHKLKWARNKGHRHEITIKTCSCGKEDEEQEPSFASTRSTTAEAEGETNPAESRLPSITEISEQTSSTPNRAAKKDERRARVRHQVYEDTDTETTEETSPT